MNKAFAAIFIFAISALLLSGCVQSEPAQGESTDLNQTEELGSNLPPTQEAPDETPDLNRVEVNLSVSTDKNEYGSNEEAIITVIASASEGIEKVTVKVWGITPYSKNYIENEKTIDLEKGENTIEFVETTPYCTAGCGGVYPGPYNLYASVEYYGKEIAKAQIEITLTSH